MSLRVYSQRLLKKKRKIQNLLTQTFYYFNVFAFN